MCLNMINVSASELAVPTKSMSPSAKAIYSYLHSKGKPVAVKHIIKELHYSERTIQNGLRQLRKHNIIQKTANLRDLRESLYYLNPATLNYKRLMR